MKFHKKFKIYTSFVLMLAILLALGIWQVQRLAWKEDLLARVAARMAADPAALPDSLDQPEEWEYRRVRAEGAFDAAHVFWLKPRTDNGKVGAHMFVLLRREAGQPVFINRGFVPDDARGDVSVPAAPQMLDGIVQIPHKSTFTPDNNPAKNDWYWPDTQAMARAAGYDAALPVIVTLPPHAGGYPAGFAATAQIRNNHLQYALFWFGMAGILMLVFALSQREKSANPAKTE